MRVEPAMSATARRRSKVDRGIEALHPLRHRFEKRPDQVPPDGTAGDADAPAAGV
jgi:hypothetical protein